MYGDDGVVLVESSQGLCGYAGSFQLVMVPRKISATTGPDRRKVVVAPGKLYASVMAPMVSGMCTAFGAAVLWDEVNAASEQAKSTVLLVNEETPWPLPTPW